MESRRFYTSPVGHHNLADWSPLAAGIERAVVESCESVSVTLGEEPLFKYGADGFDAIDTLADQRLASREVRIDLWCSIVLYQTLCVAFGSGVTEDERNAVVLRLEERELVDQALLRTWEDSYDEDSPQIYGYSFEGKNDDDDMEAIRTLLAPLDTPLYVAERSVVLNENGAIDEKDFDVFVDGDVVLFLAKHDEAAKSVWRRRGGEGVIAVYGDDPAEKELLERFSDFDDLRILMHEKPCAGARVTLGRCHVDDDLIVAYTPSEEPYIDHPLLFAI